MKVDRMIQAGLCMIIALFYVNASSCPPPTPVPVAVLNISPDPAYAGEIVVLDGSQSTAPSSYIIKYEWDFTNNNSYDYYETSTHYPDGAFDGKTTFAYDDIQTYTAKLRVTNAAARTDTDTDTVVIDPNNLIVYTYDEVGNRTSMTDPLGTAAYTYDILGNLTSVTNPDNKTICYQYDASGNRIQMTDPDQNVTVNTYDAANRLISTALLGPELVTNGEFDTDLSAWILNNYQWGSGSIAEVVAIESNASLTQSIAELEAGKCYRVQIEVVIADSGDHLRSVYAMLGGTFVGTISSQAAGTSTFEVVCGSEGTNLTISHIVQNPFGTAFAIDNIFVREVISETNYQYDSLGNLIRTDYPNGTYTEYTYDQDRKWLVSLVNYDPNDAVLSSYSYTYDNVGNRLSVTEADNSAVSYVYDDIYQLTGETRTGTDAYSITYQYDEVGNRTQMAKDSVATSYTYNANNQLLTETVGGTTITYMYDGNGNLASKTDGTNTTAYTWDWANRLLAVSGPRASVTYEYDGHGHRISKLQDGVMTKYTKDINSPLIQVLMESNDLSEIQTTYTYGDDLIAMNEAGAHFYYHYDGLGSTRQLTDDNGAVVASYTYDGYGNPISSSGAITNMYGFTGEQQYGEADNLVYLRARYYEASLGRFINRDPIRYGGGMNMYVYVHNNPINFVNPLGLVTSNEIMNCANTCQVYINGHGGGRLTSVDMWNFCFGCCYAVYAGLDSFEFDPTNRFLPIKKIPLPDVLKKCAKSEKVIGNGCGALGLLTYPPKK